VNAFYFDSSAIVKRYMNEIGSIWVRGITDPEVRNLLPMAGITSVEVVSAVCRRQRGGGVSLTDATTMLSDFRYDCKNQYRIIDVTPNLILHAMSLAEQHALRGYDAVQLAAALQFSQRSSATGTPLVFISADKDLNAAAVAEGLAVDDPNDHP
jgi:uncharacterized protein